MAYEKLELLIDGKWRAGSQGASEPVYNPATGEVIADVPHASSDDLDMALAANARVNKEWANKTPLERQKIIEAAARNLEARFDEIAENLTIEMGKPLAEAKIELQMGIDIARWYGEEGKRVYGRTVASRIPGMTQTVIKSPVGPVIAFVAWNFPCVNVVRKVYGALAAGCPITIKPSEETPGTAVAIGRALMDAGLPAGALNIVFGKPAQVSEHLIKSPVPRKLSFTGSVPIGMHLQKLAADNLIKCTMELGGHSPMMVFDDFDAEKAAEIAAGSKFRNAGQVCVSPTRILVQESVQDKFVDSFVKRVEAMNVTNGLDDGANMGPLVGERRLDVMDQFVNDATSNGAELRTGGNRLNKPGFFYAPTVLNNVPKSAMIMNEEPFGPVAPISTFKDVDEVISEANRLNFGLAAYAFTHNPAIIDKLRDNIESGMLAINSIVVSTPETPFGGIKHSGYGSEGGVEGLEAFLVTRFMSEIH